MKNFAYVKYMVLSIAAVVAGCSGTSPEAGHEATALEGVWTAQQSREYVLEYCGANGCDTTTISQSLSVRLQFSGDTFNYQGESSWKAGRRLDESMADTGYSSPSFDGTFRLLDTAIVMMPSRSGCGSGADPWYCELPGSIEHGVAIYSRERFDLMWNAGAQVIARPGPDTLLLDTLEFTRVL